MFNRPELEALISLRGKRALITGAAAGIGHATALRLAEAGADLELVDVDAQRLQAAVDATARWRVEARGHAIDLAQKDEIDALWQRLTGSEPDILVNCAGVFPFRRFIEADDAFFQRVLDINLHSVYRMCQRMIETREKRGGVIVNVGSIEALLPFTEGLAHYSVSKAGVLALTRALAKEFAGKGFRVNAVLPGGIITPGTKAAARQVLQGRLDLVKTGLEFKQRLPAGHVGQPDDVARMILVLASDLASYVHGALIPVDGGFLTA